MSRIIEITQDFLFGASHTLERNVDAEPSRRLHGHSYRVGVTLRGEVDPVSGMLIDVGRFTRILELPRTALHQRVLDDIEDLGPSTMENLCFWIWNMLGPELPDMIEVSVHRDAAMHVCRYRG